VKLIIDLLATTASIKSKGGNDIPGPFLQQTIDAIHLE
jgi:hypothetical protein